MAVSLNSAVLVGFAKYFPSRHSVQLRRSWSWDRTTVFSPCYRGDTTRRQLNLGFWALWLLLVTLNSFAVAEVGPRTSDDQRALSEFGVRLDRGRIVYPLPSNVAVGLFNPDPLLDIAVYEEGKVKVFQNMGNGRFSNEPLWEQAARGVVSKMEWRKSRRLDERVVDPHSWGDLQITYQDRRVERVSHEQMLRMSTEKSFGQHGPSNPVALNFHEVWRSSPNNEPSDLVAVGDIDNDGRIEVGYSFFPQIGSGDSTVRFVVYENQGSGTYAVEWDTLLGGGGGPFCISDIDNDGHKEWVIVRNGMSFLECYGPRQYRFYHSNIGFSSGQRPNQAIFKALEADINHNGVKELVVLNSDGSVSYDQTLIYVSEFVTKGPSPGGWSMAFNIQLARDQAYDFDMAVGQVDGVGWDEIVPGNGGFGVGEPIPIGYLWYSGTPGPFAWEWRGIETGLSSGSTAPMFVNLDADPTKELLIGGVGPLGHGSMFALKYMHDTTWSVMWADSLLRNSPLWVNDGMLTGEYVLAGANTWGTPDTTYSELHVYRPLGEKLGMWKRDSSSIQNLHFLDIDGNGKTNLIFAHLSHLLTAGHCLMDFETDTSTTGVIRFVDHPPAYRLYQNYPNPFNPQTSITFELPEDAHVELIVYDILGKEVRTLIKQELEPGTHTVNWNGTTDEGGEASSGVYFYRLSAVGQRGTHYIETRKMVFIR